jgi:hypothetical protein
MSKIVRIALCLAVSALIALPVMAQEKKKAKRTGENAPVFQLPKTITLTAEQQAKLDAVKKEYGPKVVAAQDKVSAALTAEQRKARQEAQKAAKEAGKKGKELKAAVDAAVTLSDDQKKQLEAAEGEMKTLSNEIRGKISEFLTAEQKEALKTKKKAAK